MTFFRNTLTRLGTVQEARKKLFLLIQWKPHHWPPCVSVMTMGALSCSASSVYLAGSKCPRKDFSRCTESRGPGIHVGNGCPSKAVPSSWERPQVAEATTHWNSNWNAVIRSTNIEELQSSGAILGARNPAVSHPGANTTKQTCHKIKSIRW